MAGSHIEKMVSHLGVPNVFSAHSLDVNLVACRWFADVSRCLRELSNLYIYLCPQTQVIPSQS